MSKSIPPLIKHKDHQVEIVLVFNSKHYGKIHCVTCNKWVMWLSQQEVNQALQLGLVE